MTKTMKMDNSGTVEQNVLAILRAYPETRTNDMLLFSRYYNAFGIFPAAELPLCDIAYDYRDYGLPCFETIRRARQRVQTLFPELSRTPPEKPQKAKMHVYVQLM